MRIIATTKHVDIFEHLDRVKGGHFYELDLKDDRGYAYGFLLYEDLDEAYRAAIKHIRRLHDGVNSGDAARAFK